MHLTDKHTFPKNYDFQIVNTGIDKRSSMLRTTRHRRGSSAASRALYREQQQAKKGSANDNPVDLASSPEEPVSPSSTSGPVEEKAMKSSLPRSLNGGKTDIDELTSTMSSLTFVPPSVRFGRGGRRGGLARS